MDRKTFFTRRFTALFLLAVSSAFYTLSSQQLEEKAAIESITAGELRNHIYFLASDFMGGRLGPSAEYEIAAQYVAAQFAASGVKPAVKNEDGSMSYFQGVPFAKTVFGDKINWQLINNGSATELIHKDDFKILFGNSLNHKKSEIVYVGYGIEEPDHKWNDFKGLDVEGKVMVCLGGSPMKKGKPVLPEEINKKYAGPMGVQSKIMGLFSKGAEAIILVDVDGTSGMPFPMIPSQFDTEKYVYKGGENNRSGGMPSIYLAKPEIFAALMGSSKNNPLNDKENLLKNYKPQLLENVILNAEIEVLSEENIVTNNVIGVIPGTDPSLPGEQAGGSRDAPAGAHRQRGPYPRRMGVSPGPEEGNRILSPASDSPP